MQAYRKLTGRPAPAKYGQQLQSLASFLPQPSAEFAFKGAILFRGVGPSTLCQDGAKLTIATSGPTTFVLAGTPPIAGTKSGPRAEVGGGGKGAHTRSHFGQNAYG